VPHSTGGLGSMCMPVQMGQSVSCSTLAVTELSRATACSTQMSMCNTETQPRCHTTIARLPLSSPSQCFTTCHHLHCKISYSPRRIESSDRAECLRVWTACHPYSYRSFIWATRWVLADLATLDGRLESAGFALIDIEIGGGQFRFSGRRSFGDQNPLGLPATAQSFL
jgi:hypothetical protein